MDKYIFFVIYLISPYATEVNITLTNFDSRKIDGGRNIAQAQPKRYLVVASKETIIGT